MESLKIHRGTVIPLDMSNVDTDAIIPKDFLTRIERTGYGQFLFYYWRYDENGAEKKDFIFNQKQYQQSSILLTRKNFGCGSSREHAVWGLKDFGIKVIVAESFADIFYNNCFKNGILPISLDKEKIDYLFEQINKDKEITLIVDLESCVLKGDSGFQTTFHIADFRKTMLLEGLDHIDLTLKYEKDICAFEQKHSVHYKIN